MGSDFRMGLDTRDCRLDVGFILGDDSIPDDVTWNVIDRDKTCVWLDFIDNQLDPCNCTVLDKKVPKEFITYVTQNDLQQPGCLRPEDLTVTVRENVTEASKIENKAIVSIPVKSTSTTIKLQNPTVEAGDPGASSYMLKDNKDIRVAPTGKRINLIKVEKKSVVEEERKCC